ncbi:tiggy-winkle hedgehog protein [Nephila pilipes]|uniref:Hedgehog protein n=1 Tax=Nephila pilipes TaxID=299642 RepID=A0A8X6QXN4_NEPPI|nr:tiggy-winkle hedgehog protein [Nephila pilipes]
MFRLHLVFKFFLIATIVLQTIILTSACGPAVVGKRKRPRTGNPLVFKEHVPSSSECSNSASGPAQRKIKKNDPAFRNLVVNYSEDIIFKNDKVNASDRVMNSRLKKLLDNLSIMVMNTFKGVKLRVVKAWDEDNLNASTENLHSEGRAVDITTSDIDRSKYGKLGRLAYEAGFDFVYYESRSYVHCSVKSESVDLRRAGGCFNGNSIVYTPEGEKLMSELSVGDEVLVVTPNGSLGFSKVVLFLDHDSKKSSWYYTIATENNSRITLTSWHLIFTASDEKTSYIDRYAEFAKNIRIGDYIYVLKNLQQNEISLEKVTNITVTKEIGNYAPLTLEGTIVVNNIVASCYAVISDHELSHFSFLPMRVLHNLKEASWHFFQSLNIKFPTKRRQQESKGIHWYADFLYKRTNQYFSKYVFDS